MNEKRERRNNKYRVGYKKYRVGYNKYCVISFRKVDLGVVIRKM